MDFPQSGWLPDGRRYMKHGFGCLVTGPQSSVDFDFGDRGEIDGIEPCFLADFAEGRLSEYGFESRDAVLTLFRRACTDGELRKSGGLGGLYFLSDAVDKS